jgi:hypothetical protein
MYSPEQMFRSLAPSLAIATGVMAIAGLAYGLGAPAWLLYAAIVVAVVAALPGFERWERRQHPR